jgi:DNA polymerase III subunit delta'
MTETRIEPAPLPRLLPWHASAAEQLGRAWAAKRFPHALLLQGADGLGKRGFAAWIAAAVLCENPASSQLDCCGRCASCTLAKAGPHPDLQWVVPEEGKQQIGIDLVRGATELLVKTSGRHGYKIAIIEPAHLMTPPAANSVLKTLEEPPGPSLLILITSQPSLLPATVRSRCQKLTIHRPTREEASRWLQAETGRDVRPGLLEFAGGAPLRALAYADGRFEELDEHMLESLGNLLTGRTDVTQVAAEWQKDALPDRLTWLDLWLSSAARAALAGSDDLVTFPAGSPHLPSLPHTLNISGLYDMVERARALKSQLTRTSLLRDLAVESWLIALLQMLAPPSTPSSRSTS